MSIASRLISFINDASAFARAFWNKNGSVLCITCGVGVSVASTVYACYKTLEIPEVIEEHKTAIADNEDSKLSTKEKAAIYISTGIKCARIYAGPIAGAIIGHGLELYGFGKERAEKNMLKYSLVNALAITSAYRSRVANYVGEDTERALYHGDPIVEVDSEGKILRVVDPPELGDISNYGALDMMFDKAWKDFQEGKPMFNYYKAKELEQFVTFKVRKSKMCTLNDVFEFGGHQLDPNGYKWGFAPREGCDYRTYVADFGIANAKRYENSVWGPPDDDRIEMCLPVTYIGDLLPKVTVFTRRE